MMGKKSKPAEGNDASDKPRDARFSNFATDPRFRLPSKKTQKVRVDERFSRMLHDEEFIQTAKVDRYGRKIKSDSRKTALGRLYEKGDDEDLEVDDDDIVQKELQAADAKYDPARQGGYSSSETDSESDEDLVSEAADEDVARLEQGDVETGEVTRRLAILGIDWDYINSTDLMVLFSSFLSPTSGRIDRIAVYPSEFGKERMMRDEMGPPKEIFKPGSGAAPDDDDEGDETDDERIKQELIKEGDHQDFDRENLRKYQLERLRYYYAVMTCSDAATAKKIYDATDMTEYQSSSNFLDLRFVPDDTTFDDEPRDECDKIPDDFKPKEFVTNALQSSNVKLTWDMHPEEASRKETIKRAFRGSKNDVEENDLKAYLASDSEDDDEGAAGYGLPSDTREGPDGEDGSKLSNKEITRRKMREALGLSNDLVTKKSGGPVGEMQVTFTAALTEKESKKSEPQPEETTIEKYMRKERDRKEKKRQQSKAKRGLDEKPPAPDVQEADGEDLGFDDPFFTAEAPEPQAKKSVRKEERRKKKEERDAANAEAAAQRAQLEQIMADDDGDDGVRAKHLDHFDMKEIRRAEKKSKRKKKGKSSGDDRGQGDLQEGFQMDVEDSRFKAVFDDPQFAIDPSNPNYKGTENMKKLLSEGRKKRRNDEQGDRHRKKAKNEGSGQPELSSLVATLKKKGGKR